MKPIVHGLEQQYRGRLDVLYFDISDARTVAVQRTLKFSSTPHFILLKKDGERVTDWVGVTPEEKLKGAIDALLMDKR